MPKSRGVKLIARERERQIEEEGWTREHDAAYPDGSLSRAAICYATDAPIYHKVLTKAGIHFTDPWPWSSVHDKRHKHDRKRRLVIAGALIAAELDRLMEAEEARYSDE